jgi:Domain of unknown function DUF29
LLRRLAAGERVNDVDWEHVIEEIEDVERTELRACFTSLRNAIVGLLRRQEWPEHKAAAKWRCDVLSSLSDADLAFCPSMRQRIDMSEIYANAL